MCFHKKQVISSKLAITDDLKTNQIIKYAYDKDRLSRVGTIDTGEVVKEEIFEYDDADRVVKDTLVCGTNNPKTFENVIVYEEESTDPTADGRVDTYTYKVNGSIKLQTYNTFDPYKRITEKKYKINKDYFIKDIEYDHTRVSRIIDKKDVLSNDDIVLSDISYEYDALGRIIREKNIDENGNETVIKSYTYDEYGQLIREDNQVLDKTFKYEYNGIGNITSVSAYNYTPKGTEPSGDPITTSFTYNSSKPDVLSKLGNTSIGFNRNGALSSYIRNYTWSNGKLSKFMRGSKMMPGGIYEECNYSYNGYGQRVSKTYAYDPNPAVSSDASFNYTKTYTYDHSGRLINEKIVEAHNLNGNSTREIVYLYDECGMVGFTYSLNGATPTSYYYQRNLLGDVVAIYNTNGAKVVEYAYDAWGNCTIVYSSNNTLANDNPIRYRGYYLDIENNFYYLNARYYSPELRRFISPDDTSYLDPENVNGLNLYCYCYNDPVNYCDPSGHFVISSFLIGLGIAAAIGAGIGAASYTVGQVIDYAITGNFEWSWGGFVGSTVGGALGGAFTFITGGVGSAAFVSGAAITSGTMIGENISGDKSYSWEDILISAIISGGISAFSVGVMSKIRISKLNAGRGSMSAVSQQMYTKFRREMIRRISLKTFTKMLTIEAYNGIVGNFLEWGYSISGAKNAVLNYF